MEIDELDGMAAAGPSQGDQRSGETSDEEEAVLPTILQTMHHSLDDQSDDGDDGEDEGDDEGEDDHGDCNDEDDGEEDDAEEVNFHQAEEYDDDADVSEEGGPAPPAVPVPPSLPPPRDHPTIDIGLGQQIFPTTARPVASMAPVSMNQVLADTTRTPAKRRRAKTGGKARAKGKRGKGKLPPDVSRMLGEANMCYVSQDFQQAIRMLEEVVRRVPRVADPYHTLGLVYEEMDDQKRALECFLIAAYLTGKDVETWKRVATMSHEQGLLKQAIYCINRALRLAPGDVNAQYTRATVLVDLGQLKKGSEAYRTILKMRPHDAAVAAEMARLYTKNKESAQAIKVLNDCLQHNIALASGDVVDFAKEQERAANNALTPAKLPPSAKGQLLDEDEDPEETIGDDRPVAEANGKDSIPDPQPYLNAQLHLCNILAELFMSKGKFAETISVIEDLQKRGVCGTAATPLDLAVKCGICKVYIGKPEGAEEQFLRLHAEDVSTYPDLYFDVAEALLAIDSHQRALDFYEPLLKLNEYNQPAIWLKVGRCHLCLCSGDQASTSGQGRSGKDSGSALRYYTKVLQTAPNNSEAAVAIASLHVANNKPDTALRLLDQVFDQIDMVSVEAPPGFGPSTAISTQDDQHPHPQLVAVPVDTNGLQLLVERARLLHFFNRFDEFLNLVLVHIHRAVHALVPLPRSQTEQPVVSVQGRKRKVGSSTSFDGGTGSYPTLADVLTDRSLMILGAKAATIMVRYVSHWIVVADVRGVNRRVDGAMIECVAEIVLNTAWDHTGTCVSRKCDYEAVRGTINGLLRLHGRAAKPPKTDVASSALPAASKGSDSPALFAAISYPSDEDDQEDDDEDKEQDNGDKEEESANKADRLAADASRRRGEGVRRGGDKRSARHTKDGAAVDKLRLLLIGVAYILNDFETAYANIRDVCELRPSSVRSNRVCASTWQRV